VRKENVIAENGTQEVEKEIGGGNRVQSQGGGGGGDWER